MLEAAGTIICWVGMGLMFFIVTDLFAHYLQNIFVKEVV